MSWPMVFGLITLGLTFGLALGALFSGNREREQEAGRALYDATREIERLEHELQVALEEVEVWKDKWTRLNNPNV